MTYIAQGWLEHPVENIPSIFGQSKLFASYPYLLPTSVAASVTFTGCILTLFLSYDGGPRTGAIRLPEEKDVERAVSVAASLPGSVKKKLSGYFGQTPTHTSRGEVVSPIPISERGSTLNGKQGGFKSGSFAAASHAPRTSFALPYRGTAYGYDARRRSTAISRFRRLSAATSTRYAPDYEGGADADGGAYAYGDESLPPLNFAQKLLFANGEAGTFNISDVWIAAATRDEAGADAYTSAGLEEDPFAEEDEDESALLAEDSVLDEDAEELTDAAVAADPFREQETGGNTSVAATAPARSRAGTVTGPGPGSRLQRLRHDSVATGTSGAGAGGRQVSPLRQVSVAGAGGAGAGYGGRPGRSQSIMSSASRPALYQNTGLISPLMPTRKESASYHYFETQPGSPAPGPPATAGAGAGAGGLAAIPEGKQSTGGGLLTVPGSEQAQSNRETSPVGTQVMEKDPLMEFSIMRDLPVTLIAQYTVGYLHSCLTDGADKRREKLLALHGTIMDQVFMSFLVSKSAAGGLGLMSSDFAE